MPVATQTAVQTQTISSTKMGIATAALFAASALAIFGTPGPGETSPARYTGYAGTKFNPIVADAIQENEYMVVLETPEPDAVDRFFFAINYPDGTCPNNARGLFQWDAGRGFTQTSSTLFGQQHVELIPENPANPAAGSRRATTQYWGGNRGAVFFYFRFKAKPSAAPLLHAPVSISWTESKYGRTADWQTITSPSWLNFTEYAPPRVESVRVEKPVVNADGTDTQTAYVVVDSASANTLDDVRIAINQGTSRAQGEFLWNPTAGFQASLDPAAGNQHTTFVQGTYLPPYWGYPTDKVLYSFTWRVNASAGSSAGNTISVYLGDVAHSINSGWQQTNATFETRGAPVVSGGAITVRRDPRTPDSRNIAAATPGVTLASFNFRADAASDEDATLDTVVISRVPTTTPRHGIVQDVTELSLVNDAGQTVGGPATIDHLSGTSTTIRLNPGTVVVARSNPAGTTLHLRANTTTICPMCMVSSGGHELAYQIALAPGQVIARGALSGLGTRVTYDAIDAPTGNAHYLYRGFPTVESVPLSSRLASSAVIYRFRVTANLNDVGLYKVTPQISLSPGLTLLSLELVDRTNGNVLYSNASPVVQNNQGTFDILFDPQQMGTTSGGSEVTIPRGQSREFEIQAVFTGTGGATRAVVSTRLLGDAVLPNVSRTSAMNTAVGVDTGADDDFIWSDMSARVHSTSTADWVNGYLVSGMPANDQGIPTTISE